MLKYFVFILLIGLLPQSLFGQSDVLNDLQRLMINVRNEKVEVVNTNAFFLKPNQSAVLEALKPYISDTFTKVRSKAYALTSSIASNSAETTIRRNAVKTLLNGCADKDQAITLNCSRALQQFKIKDFDSNSKGIISGLLKGNTATTAELIKLAAFLQMKEQEPSFVATLSQPKLPPKNKWALQLALARFGNQEASSYILSRVQKLPLNEDLLYESGQDLVYTHSKEIFKYLFSIIISDEKKCRSANPDSDELIICGYRVLEYVSPAIKDFPINTDQTGELSGDYENSLKIARDWWAKHQDNYVFNNEIF